MAQQQNTPTWLPYAGLLLAIGGMIYQGGVISGNVARNTERIAKLEAQYGTQGDTINQINIRGASIQAKIDFLVEQSPKRTK